MIIKKREHFSLDQIYHSGQVFNWVKESNDSFTIISKKHIINIKETEDSLIIKNGQLDDFWQHYFDLNRDYTTIFKALSSKDKYLDQALRYGSGIRILNQDLWEIIISFIISANNNIKRIRSSIQRISEAYGTEISLDKTQKYYSFPTPSQLSKASIKDLRALGVGYRDKYIYKTTRMILEKRVDLTSIDDLDTESARKELKKLSGIGDKVADCILLFGSNKTDAFPVDTWVKKVLKHYYKLEDTNIKTIRTFAAEHFGSYLGYAQQYLFYYIRETKNY